MLPDLLAPNLSLVFCGTAPSRVSAERRAYYAKPGNRFWPSLYRAGLTPRLFRPHEYPALLDLGIGLTDLNKSESGVDSELSAEAWDRDGFAEKMRAFAPARIAFTSKRAASVWLGCGTRAIACGRLPERLGQAELWALPSTSGLATRWWDEAPWRALGAAVGASAF